MALLLGLPVSFARAGVIVRVEPATYPIRSLDVDAEADWAPVVSPNLVGRSHLTTTRVVLENRHLIVSVLPELGGRIERVQLKRRRGGRAVDLLWRADAIADKVPWALGGARFDFPNPDAGLHFDEVAAYTIVREPGGAVTLAMDMRFDRYLTEAETRRYGRATALRLGQFVRLEPDSAALHWWARVDNPLPIRHGVRLWYTLRAAHDPEAEVLAPPFVADTGHLAPEAPPPAAGESAESATDNADPSRIVPLGWHYPAESLSVVLLQDVHAAPAVRFWSPVRAGERARLMLRGGNGRPTAGGLLPAFGAYELRLTLVPALHVGRITAASPDLALAAVRVEGGWALSLFGVRPTVGAELEFAADRRVYRQTVNLSPDRPALVDVPIPAESPRLTVRDADGELLLATDLPGPLHAYPADELIVWPFGSSIDHAKGGTGLLAEANDLIGDPSWSLPRLAPRDRAALDETDDFDDALHRIRRLMRTTPDPEPLRAPLDRLLDARPDDPHARLYRAMLHWPTDPAAPIPAAVDADLQAASALPGARFLLALRAVGRGEPDQALAHLAALDRMDPADTFRGDSDVGLAVLQPGSTAGHVRPRLLRAIAHQQLDDPDAASEVLQGLVRDHPGLLEAWLLMGHDDHVAALSRSNLAGRQAAEAALHALRTGHWPGLPVPRPRPDRPGP